MANVESDIEGGEIFGSLFLFVIILGIVGIAGYFIYKMIACTLDSSKCNADNGLPRCTLSDMTGGNCVSSDGSACGWYEFFTATSCSKGTPTTPTAPTDDSSNSSIGSVISGGYDYATGAGDDVPPSAGAPGLPEGYDESTGMIDE